MKKFLLTLGKVLLIIIAVLLGFLWYAGFFERAYITEKETGPYYALIDEVAPYQDPATTRNNIFNALLEEDIMSEKAVAISERPFRESLINKTGWILETKNVQLAQNLEPPYQIIKIPKEQRVVADFPYDNSFSIMAGSYIAYRKLLQYVQRHNYESGRLIEIYDDGEKRIFYHLNTASDSQSGS